MNAKLPLLALFLLFAVSLSVPARADEADDAAAKALKDAKAAAAKAGVTLPDMKDDEDEKPEKTPGPVLTLPLKELPAWIPAIPGFQPKPNAEKKQQDGIETGTMTGTSASKPEEIQTALIAAAKGKFGTSTMDSNINGNKTVIITLYDTSMENREVEITLKPSTPTGVEVIYKTPVNPPVPAK